MRYPRSDNRFSLADRLENEHLGNMDQYRVTREVPLPYLFDDPRRGDDADDDDDEVTKAGKR